MDATPVWMITSSAMVLLMTPGLALFSGGLVGSRSVVNMMMLSFGAALLWFGWFGFNAGTATTADEVGLIMLNTLVAPAAGLLGWLACDAARGRRASSVGAVSGAVAGLVAITPACADLTPGWATLLGAVAGALCAWAITLKFRLGYDDSLDVVGLHLVAGALGTLFLGVFATGTGLLATGSWGLLLVQLISVLAVAGVSFAVSLLLALGIARTIGFRVSPAEERDGIDERHHGERADALARETGG